MRKKYEIKAKVVSILFDYTVHPFFECANGVDFMFTPDSSFNDILIKKGYREEQLKDLGLPVKTEFSEFMDKNEAREKLSMIVGRDTDNLDETEIIKASVETVAENTSDGVIAPLIFLTFSGPVGGMFYKAASTMDSMVGYKNDRYSQYGFFAAKLDDILNFIPSRISALLIIISSFLLCINGKGMYDGKRAFRVFKSDRFNHKSPNSAQSEAAYAGALGLKLAGGAYYFNKYVDKPYIGIETRKIEREDILRSHKILYVTSVLCEVLCTAAIFIIMKLNMIFL